MDYAGPQPADYDNVHALNRAFLELLADRRIAGVLLAGLPPELTDRCLQLTRLQRQRLAQSPFLLFSFRESDAAFWDRLFESRGQRDLLAVPEPGDRALAGLVAAGLGFVWQLARQNPYIARLICGASLHWCERLAERPLLDVVAIADGRRVLTLRAPRDTGLWETLLNGGCSSERAVGDAVRISALQRILTHARGRQPALAARSVTAPSLSVADDGPANDRQT
ncbi:MAG: hypothetical protein U5K76_09580 [Woeseiaceae bacterium]|nr:hypothetical protein [Woeseiaceae bacterium]